MPGKKVLIVEDSLMIGKAVEIILKKEGIETLFVRDGSKVVDIVKNGGIGLVMLDLMMPEISGEEVYEMLKNDEATKDTKIMILTAKTDALKWNKKLASCDSFMTKPFDNDKLAAEVKKLLNK
jgi:DNA-binding response OmpR family regulator